MTNSTLALMIIGRTLRAKIKKLKFIKVKIILTLKA